jgi:hypothetical protein
MVFKDYSQGKIGIDAKIIDTLPGTPLNKADYTSDDTLRTKGAVLRGAPRLTTESGQPATFFIGQTVPSADKRSEVPPEGIELKILPRLEGDIARYTGSVTIWTPATKLEGQGRKPAGSFSNPVIRTNTFAGDCKIGESILVTPVSGQRK